MINIKFLNDEHIHQAIVEQITAHIIEVKGEGIEPNISGFHVLTEDGAVSGEYEDYTTLYRTIDGGFQLSNDESVYVEPEPIEPEEPYEPTLQDIQEAKVIEMNYKQQATIAEGIDVKLTDGSTEHFALTQYDQQSLMGLQSLVASGQENIPWHNSDEGEHCKFYSNADMLKIITAALQYVSYHVTYFRDLRIYIRSLQDKESIQAIEYGIEIPPEHRSDVLQVMDAEIGGVA